MISLRLFILLLVTLVCREIAQESTWNPLGTAALAAAGITLGFGLLHKSLSLAILLRLGGTALDVDANQSHEAAARLRNAVETLWVVALPATLLLTGWGSWLKSFDSLGNWHTLTLLGWFLPSALFLLFIEMTAAQFEHLVLESDTDQTSTTWQQLWLTRLRLGDMPGLATCVVPVLIVAAFRDITTSVVGENGDNSILLCGMTVVSIGVFLLLLPHVFAMWMDARSAGNPQLQQRFTQFQSRLQIRGIQLRTVVSQNRWQGAAIVGWIPGFRQLWIGDGLLDQLDEREVDMVVMHELAHVTRNHFVWRMLPIIGAATVLAVVFFAPAVMDIPAAWQASVQLWGKVLGVALATLVLLGGVSVIARRCELDADRQACKLARIACDWADGSPAMPTAVLGSGLTKLIGDNPRASKATWLHPSLMSRLENLRATVRRDVPNGGGLPNPSSERNASHRIV